MIELSDPRWKTFKGGYRELYDASECLSKLESGDGELDEIWDELCEGLHHQGDVDVASYASVLQIVRICIERELLDWNAFALIGTIETCRVFSDNPPLPEWLRANYETAIQKLAAFGAKNFSNDWPSELTQSFLSVSAFANGMPNTGRILNMLGEDEINEAYDALFGSED